MPNEKTIHFFAPPQEDGLREQAGVLSKWRTAMFRSFFRLSDGAQRDHFAQQIGDFTNHVVVTLGADTLPSNVTESARACNYYSSKQVHKSC